MMYNSSNLTPESGPYTTYIEHEVGNQLCRMLGYNVDCGDSEKAVGWGHITCVHPPSPNRGIRQLTVLRMALLQTWRQFGQVCHGENARNFRS